MEFPVTIPNLTLIYDHQDHSQGRRPLKLHFPKSPERGKMQASSGYKLFESGLSQFMNVAVPGRTFRIWLKSQILPYPNFTLFNILSEKGWLECSASKWNVLFHGGDPELRAIIHAFKDQTNNPSGFLLQTHPKRGFGVWFIRFRSQKNSRFLYSNSERIRNSWTLFVKNLAFACRL